MFYFIDSVYACSMYRLWLQVNPEWSFHWCNSLDKRIIWMNFKSTLDRALRGSLVVVWNSLSQLEEQSKDTSVVAGGRRSFTCASARQLESGFEGPSHELCSMATPIQTPIRHRCRTFRDCVMNILARFARNRWLRHIVSTWRHIAFVRDVTYIVSAWTFVEKSDLGLKTNPCLNIIIWAKQFWSS